MKTIKFTAYLLYKYYSTGYYKDIPYFTTLSGLALMALLHLFQIAILTSKVDTIFPFDSSDNIFRKYFFMGLVLLPIYLLLRLLVKESELRKMTFSKEKIKRGYIFLVGYIVISLASLMQSCYHFLSERPFQLSSN